MEATLYKQDEVYIRVADLESESRVFGADLFYHKICLPNYFNKYNRKLEGCNIRKKSKKREIFVKELESIEEMIDRGFFIPISEIRNVINDKCDEELMSNKEIKLYLSELFTDRVQFCKSDRRNESMMVYSSKLTMQAVAQKLSAMNSVKDTAHAIRVALKNVDFKLEGKFCDAEEMKSSWQNMQLPDCLLLFFSTLFNIPQSTLMQSSLKTDTTDDGNTCIVEDDDTSIEEFVDKVNLKKLSRTRKVIKVMSIFQTMYYVLHNGRKKTPLHVMSGHIRYM